MPCIRIIKPNEAGVEKFKYEGAIADATAASIQEFVQSWKDGKLTAFRKSEDTPKDNDGPVRVIVGNTFVDEVIKSDNDVLVKYYAPWCGHCTALAPSWTKLGEDVKEVKGLVVAKYDATKNENEEVQVESFPTIKLYTKADKKGIAVEFNRDEGKAVNSLKNFLRKNSASYKAARPDEKIEPDDFKAEAPAEGEGKEGEDMPEDMGEKDENGHDMGEQDMGDMKDGDMPEGDMGEGDDMKDMPEDGKDAEMTDEEMKKM